MKKFTILSVLALAFAFTSCDFETQAFKDMRYQRDSIQYLQQTQLDELLGYMDIVQEVPKIICMIIGEVPTVIERCTVGQGNYVYIVGCLNGKYVFRCSEEKDAYKDTIYWLERLSMLDIPVPKIMANGSFEASI